MQRSRGIKTDAVVLDAQHQGGGMGIGINALIQQTDAHHAGAAVLHDVGQRLLRHALQHHALQGAGRGVPVRRGVPVGVNPQIIEQADKAVTQRNQPLLGCGRGGGTDAAVGIDHLPQVVAQEFEHGEVALLAGRFSVLLDAHDGAHDLPAQAVVQVLRQLQTLLQVGVVQGQGVLLGEGLAQVFAGAGDAGLQLLVGVQDALVHLLGRQQHEQQTGVGAVEVAAVQHLQYDKEVTQANQHQ